MRQRECMACQGERGCKDCTRRGRAVRFSSAAEFFLQDRLWAEKLPTKKSEASEVFFAVDIGTTTVAFACAEKETGKLLASFCMENPQRSFGADVISRIAAAEAGHAKELQTQIKEVLWRGFLFLRKEGVRVAGIAMAGNTTMMHLLLGYPVTGLSKAPFTPYSVAAESRRFQELFEEPQETEEKAFFAGMPSVHLFPGVSAFVGADALAGMYALRSAYGFNTLKQAKVHTPCLLADLGTNGELLLLADGVLYATATALGTAFEGGRFAYAADLLKAVSQARKEGVMDETGLLAEPYFTDGYPVKGGTAILYEEDIRTVQLAKGAVRAGIELLLAHAGVPKKELKQVFLAGGAGQYCTEEDLLCTGMLPEEFAGKLVLVGNSCIGGLFAYLKDGQKAFPYPVKSFNLAEEEAFESFYYGSMDFM